MTLVYTVSLHFSELNAMIFRCNVTGPVNSWTTERVDVVADHWRTLGFV